MVEDLENPSNIVVFDLEKRNRIAEAIVQKYVRLHGATDVGVGLIGLIPGAGVPALMAAIAIQGPLIYQPLARKLARVYLAAPENLESAQDDIVSTATIETAVFDLAANFGAEFLKEIAGELLSELGLGTAMTLIPFVGAIVAAGLDYAIATRMTNRVGRMVSIFFQNGGRWVESKHDTYEIAKNVECDLNGVRAKVGVVRESLLRNVRVLVELMRTGMEPNQIREALRSKRIPSDLIEDCMGAS